MAKRKAGRGIKKAKPTRKAASAVSSSKRQSAARRPMKKAAARQTTTKKRASGPPSLGAAARPRTAATRPKSPRLDRDRRTLDDETVPTPPSSLDMDRRGSAARTGRAEIAESLADHASMSPAITGGDVDADVESAYFSGDEAPGGDNPTPDQDIVDDIGRALGVEYQDNEELRASDKVAERDRKRWELDPASAEDYRERERK
jgi:uncharacterized protein DUF6335